MQKMADDKDKQLKSQDNNFNIKNKELDYKHELDLINAKKGIISAMKDLKCMDENSMKILANLFSNNNNK
jgi:hypothetical protein